MNIVITGAGRGLGLGFVRHYLQRGASIWAGFRTASDALESMARRYPQQLYPLPWDVTDPLADLASLPSTIDLLINNAGIYGPNKDGQSLERLTATTMEALFRVDCVAPLLVVQRLLQPLKAAKGVIANVSSKMGSSADNSSGGTYAYRAAKAALVIVSRSMAVDLAPRGIHVITLHPGWVQTDMTHHTGLVDVDTSVAGMCNVIEHARDYNPGAFIAFDGTIVPY
ncbi:MAG: SDR family oxidoreductase [Mariprofundaceae bacterium]